MVLADVLGRRHLLHPRFLLGPKGLCSDTAVPPLFCALHPASGCHIVVLCLHGGSIAWPRRVQALVVLTQLQPHQVVRSAAEALHAASVLNARSGCSAVTCAAQLHVVVCSKLVLQSNLCKRAVEGDTCCRDGRQQSSLSTPFIAPGTQAVLCPGLEICMHPLPLHWCFVLCSNNTPCIVSVPAYIAHRCLAAGPEVSGLCVSVCCRMRMVDRLPMVAASVRGGIGAGSSVGLVACMPYGS
jgi:hypothetical protein